MTTRTEYHGAIARDFMSRAWDYLAEDDLLQASEKGWGAGAQAVKAAAEARDWPHKNHGHLFTAIDRLVDETGDQELRARFHFAHSLHINFYEGWMTRQSVGGRPHPGRPAGGEAGAACRIARRGSSSQRLASFRT